MIQSLDPMKFYPEFLDVVFLVVAMELLLHDEEVWLVILEYRLKTGITFDMIVGSHSNL